MKDMRDSFLSCHTEVFDDRLDHLSHAASVVRIEGHFIEFGVWKGQSILKLAGDMPKQRFFGFDSFRGLPEKWVRSLDGSRFSDKNEFAVEALPTVPSNVTLIEGWFNETIEPWKRQYLEQIAFIHIDCDLYSSTTEVLHLLDDRIVPGTIIVFDELCDWCNQNAYQRWREHEWKALNEWLEEFGRSVKPISRTNWIEGAVRVIK